MLEIRNLSKNYDEKVLNHISVRFPSHGLVTITGDSGCGKSTLLQIIGGLDLKYDGEVLFEGKNIKIIKNYIKKYVGFIFQNIYLINEMTVKNNYLLPAFFKKIYQKRKNEYLKKLQIDQLYNEKTALLSGGEKQRIAIMRSFIANNKIILCDEPTGSLDQKSSEKVFSILKDLSKERLVIVVSHDIYLAKKYSHYLYRLEHGKLHLLKKEVCPKQELSEKKSHKPFCLLLGQFFRLSLKSHLLLAQIIFISIFCILLTFSLTQSSRNEIQKQIEQFIPSTSIMCKRKDHQNMSSKNLQEFDKKYIQYRCMEYANIELIGLSLEKAMTVSNMFYVSDYTQPLKHDVTIGRKYQNYHEIVVSQNTYQNLCHQFHKKTLLNKKINLFLQNKQSTASFYVKIVGITNHQTAIDTIYLKEYAYSYIINQLFHINEGEMCFLQVNSSQNLELLKKDYPLYQFQIANANLSSTIDEKMRQLENILLCFCLLIVISSCFLLGEVIYLNVVKRKRMFAIFKAMGATSFQISMLVLSQGLFMSLWAYLQAFIFLKQIVQFINEMIGKLIQGVSHDFFVIDYQILWYVLFFTFIFTVMSCLIPIMKANKIDIIEGIKG